MTLVCIYAYYTHPKCFGKSVTLGLRIYYVIGGIPAWLQNKFLMASQVSSFLYMLYKCMYAKLHVYSCVHVLEFRNVLRACTTYV